MLSATGEMESDQRQLSLIDEETPKLKVVKSNALIEAQYELSGKALKLVLIAISQIRKDQTQLFEQVFAVKDLVELLGTSESSAYSELNRIAKDLMKKQVEVRNDETGEWELYQWVTKAWCKKGHFGMRLSEDLSPYLIGLAGRYTLYELGAIIRMTSNYAIRLFELIKQWEGRGYRIFSLDPDLTKNEPSWENFPKLMGYDHRNGSYARFGNLKQRILLPAINQIETLTDIKKVSYKVIRFNRRAVAIKVTWQTGPILEKLSDHPLLPDLIAIGISSDTARKIITEFNDDRIVRNLAYTKHRHKEGKIKSPSAYLLEALKQDYADPELPFPPMAKTTKAFMGNSEEESGAENHPLYSACSNKNEFNMVLAAEKESGVPFDSYNEFYAYHIKKKLHGES